MQGISLNECWRWADAVGVADDNGQTDTDDDKDDVLHCYG